jgi:hypothetical protein
VTVKTIIQLALGLLSLANWITRKISQAEWESSGYRKATEDALNELKQRVRSAEEELTGAKKLTPEERRQRMKDAT